jgi:hypothetical protein
MQATLAAPSATPNRHQPGAIERQRHQPTGEPVRIPRRPPFAQTSRAATAGSRGCSYKMRQRRMARWRGPPCGVRSAGLLGWLTVVDVGLRGERFAPRLCVGEP